MSVRRDQGFNWYTRAKFVLVSLTKDTASRSPLRKAKGLDGQAERVMKTININTHHVRWQSVALPTEHGGWGFVSEPVVLGLLLAPGFGGLALGIVAFAAFLLHQPLKLVLKDTRAGRNVPRTVAARRFVLIYGGTLAAAGLIALLLIPSWIVLAPLVMSTPLIAVQLWQDSQNQGRSLLAELAGSMATGAFASSIVMMHGWELTPALALWLALAVRGFTSVLYVRSRLRLERSKPAMRGTTLVSHAAGLAVLFGAAALALLPWTASVAMGILTARAALGLSSLRKPRPPKVIGILEMVYGMGFVLLIAVGYALSAVI